MLVYRYSNRRCRSSRSALTDSPIRPRRPPQTSPAVAGRPGCQV